MKLHDLMMIEPKARTVALVGGGGKTTALLALAAEAAAAGSRTAVMTTTHIRPPCRPDFTLLLDTAGNNADDMARNIAVSRQAWAAGRVVVAGRVAKDGKLLRPEQALWDHLLREAEAVYVEADGSRGLPLKYPASWEPALPREAEQVLLLCGLSALDQPVEAGCHRAELVREELGVTRNLIDEELMAQVLSAGYGAYHPTVIINQADTEELARRGRRLTRLLAEQGLTKSVVLSLHNYLGGAS